MSRVITFSTKFPSYHLKAKQSTFFVEKILNGLNKLGIETEGDNIWWTDEFCENIDNEIEGLKYCTIRKGNRWKVGDKFSPRVWSGKPYNSKQIIIAPDIEIKKVYDIVIDTGVELWMDIYINGFDRCNNEEVAKNDGLSLTDFFDWFHNPKKIISQRFEGQIICWNENINY